MKKQRFRPPLRIIFLLAIIFLALFLLIGYIWKVLKSSDFFTVRQVVVRNSDAGFDYLKGRNIFLLDLKTESLKARLGCTDCLTVRFARIFPNCVFVDFVKRNPIALVKSSRDFEMDKQGVLFYPAGSSAAGLPVVYGLKGRLTPGTRYNRPDINLALGIIAEFNANGNLKDFSLTRVDVANLESAWFFMVLPKQGWIGFEVRTGENNIRAKMMVLGGLVKQARDEWARIKYIDLRFTEPVIKFKDAL